MILGMIFDFDGLILDTEWPVYQSWLEMYQSYNADLPFEQWASIIGVSSFEHFDPFELLESQVNQPLDRQRLQQIRLTRELELVSTQPILPGVESILKASQKRNLRLGIASSSDYDWVGGHLQRLDLADYFEVVHTSDDVERAKPDPTLYHLTLESLNISPSEAIVFEDSPNGIRAATDAGIFTVAVPNLLTKDLNLSRADLVLKSLADISLDELIALVEEKNS